MASGSQNMTTYNARIVTGSNNAASPEGALLLSGAGRADDATGDTWIFLNSLGGLTNPWGIKHDEANNKLQIFGSGTNSFSVRMDTGDTYILGKVGIGYDPETSGNTYKLYVDGTSYFTNNLTMNGGTITLWGERYNGNYGLDCNNSDIINVNSIRMADNAETYGEGLMFKNGSSGWDCMAASGGTFYFRMGTDGTPALSNANSTANLRCNLINSWHFDAVSSLNANDVRTTNGIWACAASITNAAMTNHSVLFGASNVGTPFQLQIPDSSHLYIYKRWYSSGAWSGWSKISAGYADSAGSVAWDNVTSKPATATRWPSWSEVTGKPGSFTPASHTHTWLELAPGNKAASTGAAQSDDTGPFTVRWYSSTGRIAQQPTQYGFLITCSTGKGSVEQHALWLEQCNGHIYHRGTNGGNNTAPPAFKKLWQSGDAVTNAVWNDLGESRKSATRESGYAITPSGTRSSTRLEPGARIISDTWGFLLGDENDTEKAPVAIAGRVLAYPLHDKSYYEVGDAVCAAEGGKIDKMSREEIMMYPDRILGIVNEIPDYDIWEPSREGGARTYTYKRTYLDRHQIIPSSYYATSQLKEVA